MNCIDCQEQLVGYVDGALDPAARQACKQHMAECTDCRQEHEAVARLHTRLVAHGQAAASVSVANRVMIRIRNATAEPARPKTVALVWRWAMGLGAVAAAVVMGALLFESPGSRATAAEIMARGVQAVQRLAGVHLVCKVRTAPADNFAHIDPNQDFARVELWKEFGAPRRWRVEKPGRVAVMDGQTTLLYLRSDNSALKVPQPASSAFDTGWLHALADLEGTLSQELRVVERERWQMSIQRETDATGAVKAIVTVEARSSLPDGDYLKNAFFNTADTRRIYRFDDRSGRLEALQVYMHTANGPVLVVEAERIDYNPPLDGVFALALPQDVNWMGLPGASAANPKYAGMDVVQLARVFFEACGREDWDEVGQFWPAPLNDRIKGFLGGLEIVSLGQPFTSAATPSKFVPYEIKLRNGQVRKHNLALRQNKQTGRWFVDGGL